MCAPAARSAPARPAGRAACDSGRAADRDRDRQEQRATRNPRPCPQAPQIAPCHGWIDEFVGKFGDAHFASRFTPPLPKGTRSAINLRRFEELNAAGRAMPADPALLRSRDRTVCEDKPAALTGALSKRMRAQRVTCAFFAAPPPGFRRKEGGYVVSAGADQTCRRRRVRPIEASAARLRLSAVTSFGSAPNGFAGPATQRRPVATITARRCAVASEG